MPVRTVFKGVSEGVSFDQPGFSSATHLWLSAGSRSCAGAGWPMDLANLSGKAADLAAKIPQIDSVPPRTGIPDNPQTTRNTVDYSPVQNTPTYATNFQTHSGALKYTTDCRRRSHFSACTITDSLLISVSVAVLLPKGCRLALDSGAIPRARPPSHPPQTDQCAIVPLRAQKMGNATHERPSRNEKHSAT